MASLNAGSSLPNLFTPLLTRNQLNASTGWLGDSIGQVVRFLKCGLRVEPFLGFLGRQHQRPAIVNVEHAGVRGVSHDYKAIAVVVFAYRRDGREPG